MGSLKATHPATVSKLYCEIYGSGGVVLVHGSGPADRDSGGQFVALREFFAGNGYSVLAYGQAGGWRVKWKLAAPDF